MAIADTKPVLTIIRRVGDPHGFSRSEDLHIWGRVDKLVYLEKTECCRCHEVIFAGWLNVHTNNFYCESCVIDVDKVACDIQGLEARIKALKLSEQKALAVVDRLRNSEGALSGVIDDLEYQIRELNWGRER